jgi:hypothetical protein
VNNAFKSWIGQHVVMQVALGQIRLSLRGKLLEDQKENLLMQLDEGPEAGIPKVMVLAIEEGWCSDASHILYLEGLQESTIQEWAETVEHSSCPS